MPTRRADPHRDLSVIDARAPRFNQTVVGAVSLLAVATGGWPLLALLAIQLAVGLVFGRRYCLPCVAYFEWIQPRIGEGPLEDARAPRFANIIGAVVLGAATAAHAAGLHRTGSALGLLVAVLALLAATTGLCVGCSIYRIAARLRGVRARPFDRIDLEELGGREGVVLFTHPLCSDCAAVQGRLSAEARPLLVVDVAKRPDLARKYGVALVPFACEVRADGSVARRLVAAV